MKGVRRARDDMVVDGNNGGPSKGDDGGAARRYQQYSYSANASLVLKSGGRSGGTKEPTGEAESLWGKVDPKSFGDRAGYAKPEQKKGSGIVFVLVLGASPRSSNMVGFRIGLEPNV